jgi:putative membrane protein
MENNQITNARDHLANERTYLAWIRTSLSITALGLAVVKFSVFENYSNIVGIILVGLGMLTAILPFMGYKNSEKQLNKGYYKHSSLFVTILTGCIFLVSLLLLVYIIKTT